MFARVRRRSTTRQTAAGPEISIPAKLHLFMFLFLSVWLALWGLTEFLGLRTLLTAPKGFLIVWFIVWTMGGALALYICAWMIAGREIRLPAVRHPHDQAHPFRPRPRSRIRSPAESRIFGSIPNRTIPRVPAPLRSTDSESDAIAFEHGGKTVRFADGVSEDERHTRSLPC